MDSLFTPDDSASNEMKSHSGEPLAARMRPHSLSEIAGQKHILAEGKLLRRAIEADRFTSLIFYGPPGTGKTTLASVIARSTGSRFESLNGVESNVAEIRAKIEAARTYQTLRDQTTVLFIDEIHRFNKAQQDSLLPHLERGTVRFIGATTHNPYFYVNSPLVSRSQIFQLEPVATNDLVPLLERALNDQERGFGKMKIEAHSHALRHLAEKADGDARKALTALELAVLTTPPENGTIIIDLAIAEESIQKKAVLYDSDGDQHYDTISAFIKSIRGSDPDAAPLLALQNAPCRRRSSVHRSPTRDLGLRRHRPCRLLCPTARNIRPTGLRVRGNARRTYSSSPRYRPPRHRTKVELRLQSTWSRPSRY